MATAVRIVTPAPVPTPPPPTVEYTLTLTEDEAKTLKSVLSKISGDPDHSVRRHTDAIERALLNAGVGISLAASVAALTGELRANAAPWLTS